MANANEKLNAYYREIANTFPPKVQQTLKMIADPPLELLALRRYVIMEKELDARWVWSAQQIRDFENSALFKKTQVQIDKVKKAFQELNPGYTLGSSPIRDLNSQVKLWKRNKKVHAAADYVKRECLKEIVDYPDVPDLPATKKFRVFLRDCPAIPKPTSAAPGLSDHGQMHAVDFVVMKDGKTIAGTDTSTMEGVWNAPGWTRKLKEAVTSSASLFEGPLKDPPEAWHYTLRNASAEPKKRKA